MAVLPSFLVIGAARSGTTALYTYLNQHPQIFMCPVKETNFFAAEDRELDYVGPGADYVLNSIRTFKDYTALFEKAPQGTITGEASPLYLYTDGTAEHIKARLPDVRLIAILRDPAEQAFSHYLYARRQMLEPESDFMTAMDLETQRLHDRWPPMFQYSNFPRYGEQLQRFFSVFPKEQIEIYLYEDFEADSAALMADIFRFVGVDPSFAIDFSYRPNVGGDPKNRAFQDFIMKPHWYTTPIAGLIPEEVRRRIRDMLSKANSATPQLPAAAKARLRGQLRDDVLVLQDLIGRDLSAWLD